MSCKLMEHLQEYSSESETESSSSAVETEELPEILFYNTYLESYTLNAQNMSSLYLYINWRPSSPMLNKLKMVSTKIMQGLQQKDADFYNSFQWSLYGAPSQSSTSNYGRFSVTNLKNFRDFHITLGPNIVGPSYKIEQFIENLNNEAKKIKVNKKLIKNDNMQQDHQNNLNRLLFKNSNNPSLVNGNQKKIQLSIKPKLSVHASVTSKSLFLAISIKNDNLQDEFFAQLRNIIHDQKDKLGLSWYSKLNTSSDSKFLDQYKNYHTTLLVGEFKKIPSTDQVKNSRIKAFEICQALDLADLQDIKINIDSISVDIIGHNRVRKEIKLNLDDYSNKKRKSQSK